MARGGGYCCECIIEILFSALLSISVIAVIFFVFLIFFNKDFQYPGTFPALCISAVWNFSGVLVSVLGLFGIWMNKSALLNLGCYYFYLSGIHMGIYSLTLILPKNPFWKKIISYNEPLFMNMLLKVMLNDKRLIKTISYLITTVASFYFALIIRSRRENMVKKSNRLATFQNTVEMHRFQHSEVIHSHMHMKDYFKYLTQYFNVTVG